MILQMTLKRKWFDMIESGEKKEEYREVKPFWDSRLLPLVDKPLPADTVVRFYNGGYCGGSLPMIEVVLHSVTIGEGRPRWGAAKGTNYYVLSLGQVVERRNIK